MNCGLVVFGDFVNLKMAYLHRDGSGGQVKGPGVDVIKQLRSFSTIPVATEKGKKKSVNSLISVHGFFIE